MAMAMGAIGSRSTRALLHLRFRCYDPYAAADTQPHDPAETEPSQGIELSPGGNPGELELLGDHG